MNPPRACTGRSTGRMPALLGVLLMAAACAGPAAQHVSPGAAWIEAVAMVPVQNMSAVYGPSRSVRNPLSGSVFITGTVDAAAAAAFEAAVFSRAGAVKRFRLLPPERVAGVMSALTAKERPPILDRSLWLESGRALNADAVLVAFLYRYIDRVGSRYAAEVPASAAFDLYLLRAVDGRIVWSGKFDETQRALSENLLDLGKFMKRKGWVSVAELTAAGLDELFADLDSASAHAPGE